MRILLLSTTFGRYDSRIFHHQARTLASAGHEVIVLCADGQKDEDLDHIKIISTSKKISGRLSRFLFTSKRIKKRIKDIDYDVVQLSNPESLPLIKYFVRKGKGVVFDSREDYSAFISEKPWIPRIFRRLVAKCYAKYEKKCLKLVSKVITVTPFLTEKFASFHPNVVTVANYPFLSEEIVNEGNPYGNLDLCFFGTISNDDMHGQIMETIKGLPYVRYHLLSAGTDKQNSAFREKANSLGLHDRFVLYSKMPYEQISSFLRGKDAGVILRRYAANYGYHRGSLGVIKFFRYMSAGLPIICTDFVEWKAIIDKYACGICVNPNDMEAIKKAIVFLRDNPQQAHAMGENARLAFRSTYNWETQVETYLSCFCK